MSNNGGNRASLLSGLRTGGVRSASGPMPHTAAPGGSFQIPRYPSSSHSGPIFEEDFGQTVQYNAAPNPYATPMTAGFVDPRSSRFQQHPHSAPTQQQMAMRQAQLAAMGGMHPFSPMDAQAFQLQMMQAMVSRFDVPRHICDMELI